MTLTYRGKPIRKNPRKPKPTAATRMHWAGKGQNPGNGDKLRKALRRDTGMKS